MNIIKLFKEYYKRTDFEVSDIDKREFGWLTKDGVMMRHKSFKTAAELKSFLVREIPLGIYYSTALYKDPENRDMEAKGWLGADLVFDIDGDHLDTPNCRGMELVTLGCLEDAKEEAIKLLEILYNELNLDAKVVFSGHRGFHIHVEGPLARRLTAVERRRLVDFILARSLDFSKFALPKTEKRLYEVEPIGSLARVASAARGRDPAVHVDEVVTTDIHRLIRLPRSLHNKTGLVVLPLDDLDAPVERIVEKAIAFEGTAEVKLRAPVAEALGEKIGGRPGDKTIVPAHIAVYLYLQGLAYFIRGV